MAPPFKHPAFTVALSREPPHDFLSPCRLGAVEVLRVPHETMDRIRHLQGANMGTVTATPAALELLAEIVADHGPVLFHQSGGCCDGSAPMCYAQGDFRIGEHDVLLGEIGGMPFYISGAQHKVWKHTDLTIDVVPGRGGMFSLDNGRERRFLTRSDLCAT